MDAHHRDLVVVGASAGGVEALRDFVGGLPTGFAASVLVVLHLPASAASALPHILRRCGSLPVQSARNQEPLRHGFVHVAPPDRHLLVSGEHMELSSGPAENGYRPAIDALFRSAARTRGPRVIGVVLSGLLDDGVAGLAAIKSRGGVAFVQDPEDALYRGMPENVLSRMPVDHVLPAAAMGEALAEYVCEAVDEHHELPELPCPSCAGTLSPRDDEIDYRCDDGHVWTAQTLLERRSRDVEDALWAALRALEEKRDLAQRMTAEAQQHGFGLVAERYEQHHDDATHAAMVLRRFLLERLSWPGNEVGRATG
ncbi:chemotaxis protein CheB [Amycolatopsis sp.]|uniref:chemotaxis protein CheB n=1 Tax=Amycolatopsis sp. TaxID=37632 RepID=UPI002CB2B28C|nr:chemotaxis protein CheB [Amycolatopsis sp.]HVV09892.1 chemotaxis protein CheB [Amycolatopsis sp.]